MIAINIKNSSGVDRVAFLRGIFSAGIYDSTRVNLIGSKSDCTAGRLGTPDCLTPTTLFFPLTAGSSKTLILHDNDTLVSAVVWLAPDIGSILAKGPMYQNTSEFTIGNTVSFDLSCVEGFSGNMSTTWKPESSNDVVAIKCVATKPDKLKIYNLNKMNAVLPPKAIGDTTDSRTLDDCPAAWANDAYCQHECRKFHAAEYSDPDSYCGWLYENKCQAYCWALDELMCVNETCGYGGDQQPAANGSDTYNKGYTPNVYSCGAVRNSAIQGGGTWWPTKGCDNKKVNGVLTNPQPQRENGAFTIEFLSTPWLTNATAEPLPQGFPFNTWSTCSQKFNGDSGGGGGSGSKTIMGFEWWVWLIIVIVAAIVIMGLLSLFF